MSPSEGEENAVLWEDFCSFETCVRDSNTESFDDFFTRWEARLEKLEVHGLLYPDQLLVMKLSLACHLDLITVINLLNIISGPGIKSEQDTENGEAERLIVKAKNFLCKVKQEETGSECKKELMKMGGDLEVYFDNEMFVEAGIMEEGQEELDDDMLNATPIGKVKLKEEKMDLSDFEDGEGEGEVDVMNGVDEDFDVDYEPEPTVKKRKKKVLRKVKAQRQNLTSYDCDECGKADVTILHSPCCQEPYFCSHCDLIFQSQTELDLHTSKHKSHTCSECGQSHESLYAHRKHLKHSSCAKKVECKICSRNINIAFIERHEARHMRVKQKKGTRAPVKRDLVCPRDGCGCAFTKQERLDYHLMKHDDIRNYQCDKCEEKFFIEKSLLLHQKQWHTELDTFCEKCGKSGKGIPLIKMQQHLRRCASEWKCGPCDLGFNDKRGYEKHMAKHEEISCQKCGKIFLSGKKYRIHMTQSSCAERVPCKFCGKQLSQCHLKKHEGKHKSDQNFMCPRDGCGECFHNKIQLDIHLRKHDGIRDFECNQCDRKFFSKLNLTRHIDKVHLKKFKIHNCGICGKQFSAPCKLEDHIRSHTGEKPFQCDLCDKSFTRKDRVKKHMDTVHKGIKMEQPVKCELCHKGFTKKWNWTQHMKKVHKMENFTPPSSGPGPHHPHQQQWNHVRLVKVEDN